MNFNNKCVVISGGMNGIGYAVAKRLLENGVSGLAILDIAKNDSQIESLQTRFQQSKILFLSVDVTDCTSVERTFSKISIEFTHIDILINAAGILNESDATQCVKVNLLGVINNCQTAMKWMGKKSGFNEGIIINIASILGVKILAGLPIYCATKHAVVAYTKTMAESFNIENYGIKFINVCPGKTQTAMISNLFSTLRESGHLESTMISINQDRSIQSADDCAICIIEVIALAKNGSSWAINAGKITEILPQNDIDYEKI